MSQTLHFGPRKPRAPLVAGEAGVTQFLSSSALPGSYASFQDLVDICIPDNTRFDFNTAVCERWLRIASRFADSHVGQRFKTPLKLFSDAWVWAVCEIAFSGIMGKRGHDPEAKTERTVEDRRRVAVEWILQAKDYEITPDPRLVLTEPFHVGQMYSDQDRGWSSFDRAPRSAFLNSTIRVGKFF